MNRMVEDLNARFEGFSIKELVKSMCIWVLICTFIGVIFYGITAEIEANHIAERLSRIENLSKDELAELEALGASYSDGYNSLMQEVEKEKEITGKDFPIEGINMHLLVIKLQANAMIGVVTLSSLIGTVIGSVIYVVAIHKVKGWQLLLEVALLAIVIYMIFSIFEEMENEITEYLPAYIGLVSGVFVIVYAINTIKQIIITKKLNKELEHKD